MNTANLKAGVLHLQNLHERHGVGDERQLPQDEKYLHELALKSNSNVVSDLHLQFPDNKKYLKANPL